MEQAQQTIYYIGFKKLPNLFPQEGSVVSIDSDIVERHIKDILSERDPYINLNFPLYNVHTVMFKKYNPAYPYVHQIPKTENEMLNKLDSSKMALPVKEVITYENNTIEFKLDLTGVYNFHTDIDAEKRFLIVDEKDITCIDIIPLMDNMFVYENKLKENEFGFFIPKYNKWKVWREPSFTFLPEQVRYICNTGMKEYSPLVVFNPPQENKDGLDNNVKTSTKQNQLDEVKGYTENIIDVDFGNDFGDIVDTDMILSLHPLKDFAIRLYDSVLDSLETNEIKISDSLNKSITENFLRILSVSDIGTIFYDENDELQNE